jgi:hypothetical protein
LENFLGTVTVGFLVGRGTARLAFDARLFLVITLALDCGEFIASFEHKCSSVALPHKTGGRSPHVRSHHQTAIPPPQ